MASEDDFDEQERTSVFDGFDGLNTNRNPSGMPQTDLNERLEWLSNQCLRSSETNAELMNKLKTQEEIIRNLQTGMMPNIALNQIMGGLLDSKSVQIVKLTSKNFRTWAKEIEIVFKEQELWNVLLGLKKYPGTISEREFTVKEMEKGYRLIYQSCDDSHREVIVNLTDPKAAWDKINKLYKPDNAMSRLMAMKSFFETKIRTDESMEAYLRRHHQNYRDFVSAGQQELSDSFIAQHILLSLPEEFDYVRSMTNTLKIEDLTIQRVSDILLSEWQQRELMKGKEQTSTQGVYVTRTIVPKKTERVPEVRCFRCRKVGHKIKDCWFKDSSPKPDDKDKIQSRKGAATSCLRVLHKPSEMTKNPNVWIVDSAATCHISFDRSDFADFSEVNEVIEWGSDSICEVKGRGKVNITSEVGNQVERLELHSVLYIPDFRYKVFAIGAATRFRDWTFVTRGCTITAIRSGIVNFIAERNSENFYITNFKIENETDLGATAVNCEKKAFPTEESVQKVATENKRDNLCAVSAVSNQIEIKDPVVEKENSKKRRKRKTKKRRGIQQTDQGESVRQEKANDSNKDVTEMWHRRFGHACHKKIKDMKDKAMVRGMEEGKVILPDVKCHCCAEMKAVRNKFNKQERQRAANKLDVVHSDVCGPMRIKSAGGASYILTFLDDHSRKSDVYLLKSKTEVFDKFKVYKARVERETGRSIKVLRSDNGSEYSNTRMNSFLEDAGIKREFTTVYTPQQNGASERLNRTLVEKARCLLRDASMPEEFWGEAVLTANYIRNRTKTSVCNDCVPMELWDGRKPSVKFFRIFGCCAYARVPRPAWKGKFGPRAIKGVFVGYEENRKAYRIFSQEKQEMISSRDVKFFEDEKGWVKEETDDKPGKESNDYVLLDMNIGGIPEIITEVIPKTPEVERIQETVDEVRVRDSQENIVELSSSEEEVAEEPNEDAIEDHEDEGSTIEEEINRWRDKRNLRERTPAIRPAKYTMVAGVPKKREPSLEELTRQFGWRNSDWYD
jgi:transposase InsO family protein